jgi:hypothetical protein
MESQQSSPHVAWSVIEMQRETGPKTVTSVTGPRGEWDRTGIDDAIESAPIARGPPPGARNDAR